MDLKDVIRNRGLKQAWIAEKIGVSEPDLSLIVRGKKHLPTEKIEALAGLLGMSVADLVRVASNSAQVRV